jgi:hypothetical protein
MPYYFFCTIRYRFISDDGARAGLFRVTNGAQLQEWTNPVWGAVTALKWCKMQGSNGIVDGFVVGTVSGVIVLYQRTTKVSDIFEVKLSLTSL